MFLHKSSHIDSSHITHSSDPIPLTPNNTSDKDSNELESQPCPVTFVDTPGQDIFFRMRNYGAAVADMSLLVVGLDDGVSRGTGRDYVSLCIYYICV